MSHVSLIASAAPVAAEATVATSAAPEAPSSANYMGDIAVALFADVMRSVGQIPTEAVAVDGQSDTPEVEAPVDGMPLAVQLGAMSPDAATSAALLNTATRLMARAALVSVSPTGTLLTEPTSGRASPTPRMALVGQAVPPAAVSAPTVLMDGRVAADDAALGPAPALATATVTGTATPGLVAVNPAGSSHHEAVLQLAAKTPAMWRQPLQEALGDRLQLQLKSGSEQAVIRLDPPSLGSIEIVVRHEAGALQVHLRASNGEVLRQLQHLGEQLRQDLSQRQNGEVTVTVGDGARDAQSSGRQRQNDGEAGTPQSPGQALQEADDGHPTQRFVLAEQGEGA